MTNKNLDFRGEELFPRIKFNAIEGIWQISSDGSTIEIRSPELTFDFEAAVTGWFWFCEGQPAERVPDSSGQPNPKPSSRSGAEWQRGFEIPVYSDQPLQELDGASLGHRIFTSTSIAVNRAVNEIYKTYLQGADNHPGQLPVFLCDGVRELQGRHGQFFGPRGRLIRWRERPTEGPLPAELMEWPGPGGPDNELPDL